MCEKTYPLNKNLEFLRFLYLEFDLSSDIGLILFPLYRCTVITSITSNLILAQHNKGSLLFIRGGNILSFTKVKYVNTYTVVVCKAYN